MTTHVPTNKSCTGDCVVWCGGSEFSCNSLCSRCRALKEAIDGDKLQSRENIPSVEYEITAVLNCSTSGSGQRTQIHVAKRRRRKIAILAQFPADAEFVKGFDGDRVSLTTEPEEALVFDSIFDATRFLPVLSAPYSRSQRISFSLMSIDEDGS